MNKLFASVLTFSLISGNMVADPSYKSGLGKVALGAFTLYHTLPIIKNRISNNAKSKTDSRALTGAIVLQESSSKASKADLLAKKFADYSVKGILRSFVPGLAPAFLIIDGAKEIYDTYKFNKAQKLITNNYDLL